MKCNITETSQRQFSVLVDLIYLLANYIYGVRFYTAGELGYDSHTD